MKTDVKNEDDESIVAFAAKMPKSTHQLLKEHSFVTNKTMVQIVNDAVAAYVQAARAAISAMEVS